MENSMLKVGGQHFRCACGANVFHKGVKPGLWICNGCGTEYADETYDNRKSNADRIRTMSDEELAGKMSERAISTICDIVCQGNCNAFNTLDKTSHEVCKDIIAAWLQQPAEEEP